MVEAFDSVKGLLGTDRAAEWDVVETLVDLDPKASQPILEKERSYAAVAQLDSIELLKKLAEDPDTDVRWAALARLIFLKAPSIGRLLVERMRSDANRSPRDGTAPVAVLAALGLGRLGAKEFEGELIGCLETGDEELAEAVADSLGKIGGPKALEALRAASRRKRGAEFSLARARLGDPDVASEVAKYLEWGNGEGNAELLGRLGPAGLEELLKLSKSPFEHLHPYAMAGLAWSDDPRARAALEAALLAPHHPALREAAAKALQR